MPASPDIFTHISSLMASRLDILLVQRRTFSPGTGIASSVVNSYRLLFVRSGVLDYALEGWTGKVRRGGILLVPAWMKRGWKAGPRHSADLSWVEFNPLTEGMILPEPLHWKGGNHALEAGTFARMLNAWKKIPRSQENALMIEGELKASLGRIARGYPTAAQDTISTEYPSPAVVQEVVSVAGWIEQHYARPDVLDMAMRRVRSSDHYFRTRFRERTGFTLGQYALMVRMRRSRYLLSSTAAPIKEVAWQVGFRDPLHFSRCYRKFWGISPRADCR